MQTTRILTLLFALIAAICSSDVARAATIFTDDFESGNLNNWTTTGSSPLTIATGTNVVPVGGNNSALIDTSADRMHRNIIADNGGSEISGHTVFTYWFYDNAGTASRVFVEIRGYAGGTGLPNGGSTAVGTLAQLIAFGKYNQVTLPGDTAYNATKYQARVAFTTNATIYWFNLDGAGSPNRSVGWHKFTMEREASGGTIHFYIDGILARTVTDAVNESLDSLVLGLGAGTTVGDGWLDGFELSSGTPTITSNPQPATVVAGGNVSFSVTQVGGVTYQWTHAGTNLPGATASTLSLTGVHDGHAGDYAVIVGNTAGTTTSAIASLTVTHLPDLVFVSDNGPAGFSGPLAGTVDDQFVTLLQNNGYNVIRFNSDNSAAVLLTQAQIDALNTNDLIILGRSLGSGAFGPGQGSQWNTNITKPIIAQSAFLTRSAQLGWFVGSSAINNIPMPLTAVSPGDPENAYLFAGTTLNGATTAANYDEALGQNTSQTVDAPVAGANILATGFGTNNVIVEIPAGVTVRAGAETIAGYRMFFASGNREPSGGTVPQAGAENLTATGESIFLRAVKLALNGGVAPNLGEPVVITTQPAANTDACALLPMSLSVTATGQDPLSYQWYFSDGATFTNALAEGTRSTLTYASFDATNAGYYAVVITNALGSVTSSVAAVNLVGTGTVATALISLTNCPGTPATFTTTATGSGTLTYTWRKNGTVVQGPDAQNSYTIASVVLADAGTYSVEVAGQCNTVTNSATLTVISTPVISGQPQNTTAPMGNSATFTVAASTFATQPTTYQWQTNGVDVTGATGTSLTLSGLTLAAHGMQVRVAVSNCAGGLLSSAATLSVTPIAGVSFNFNSPLQFTNTPYYLTYNDWLNSSFNTPVTVFEDSLGGVGPAPGSGSLNLIPNNGTVNSAILIPLSYDFSLPGKTLTASAMVKIKNPVNNNRNTQIGFLTTTNGDLDNAAGRVYMSVLLQSTAQPAPTYELRTGNKPTALNSFQEGNAAAAGTLVVSNWYRINATFVNTVDAQAGTYRITATVENMGPDGLGVPAAVATISSVTITNADITAARNVFFVLRGIENTGVEGWDNVSVSSTVGPIAFVQQPASQTAIQGDRVTFRALVDGDGPYTYQWSKNGTPISGATGWKYVTPPTTTADNGATYAVEVTGPANSIMSDDAILTVTPDALAVVSAGSVDGTTVGVLFNQPVTPASAENAANYTINGVPAVQARIYRSSLGPLGGEGIYVVVTPASVISGAFTVTVSGVQDLSGGAIGAGNSAAGTVAGLTGYDVNEGITGPPGENYSFGPGQFIVTGGGADIFGVSDQFRYVYTTKTGDFDVVTRVPYFDVVRNPSKAGFDARASLSPFSPHVTAAVNPMWPGRNQPEGVVRTTWNIATGSWGNNPTYNLAWYPNTWLRFRRVGNTFMRYSSTNGVNWLFDGQTSPNPALPETVYLGLAVCAVANNNPASAQFENYGPFAGYAGATIAITSQPTNFTVAAGSSFTDGLVATLTGGGAPASAGELSYIWQRNDGSGNWTNLPTAGATNNTIAIGPLFSPDNGATFRVIVKAPGATDVTSATFTATITDTAAPTVAGANSSVYSSYPVSEVLINFSEPVSAASALNLANYSVTNASGAVLTVTGVEFLNGDPRTVLVRVDGQLGYGTSFVRISGVQDLNGNTVATVVRSFRSFAPATAPVVVEYYQDIGAGTAVDGVLTNHAIFTAGQPSWISYSNLFGVNVGLAASVFPGVNFANGTVAQDQYGVKAYTYFVPPTNGQYKFWIRSDDGLRLFMNTNGTDPAGKSLIMENTAFNGTYTNGTVPANSITNITLTGGQSYYMEALMKEGGGGDGFSVIWTAPGVNTAPASTAFIPTANLAYPASAAPSTPVVSEMYVGYTPALAGNGNLPTLTSATNFPNGNNNEQVPNWKYIAGLPDQVGHQKYFGMQPQLGNTRVDNYLGRILSYFVAPSNGNYRFYLRADDAAQLYMNTNAVNSTDASGKKLLGRVDAFTSAYTLVAQNVSLVAGQKYYLEALWREGGGGDGVAVAVRSQGDATVPPIGPPPNVLPSSMLEYPMEYGRAGAVKFDGILTTPVVEGQTFTLTPAGVRGAMMSGAGNNLNAGPGYGFVWFKNGVRILENSFTNVQPPVTMADNGAVFTLLVTNQFSSATRSITINVTPDTTAPSIQRIVGWRNRDGFTIQFSERMDAASATYLGSYAANNGLSLLSATLDASGRMLAVRTELQAPGTTYNIAVSGLKDASTAGNVLNTNVAFSTWSVGGSGFLVEIFTNLNGGAIVDLTGAPKFAANLPDVSYYTNVFGIGAFGADTGLNFYGARITGFFVPTNTGYYRFYMRSDDASQLYMNINGSNSDDPAGRTMLIHMPSANVTMQSPMAMSVPVLLNQGQAYYTEALLKEGTGGDYLLLTFRNTDSSGTAVGAVPPLDTVAELQPAAGNWNGAPGNPDVIQITATPPSELTVGENDAVSLAIVHNRPANMLLSNFSYQWQRFDGASFTNIPGANGSAYNFFAPLTDDGRQIRLIFSAPGVSATYTTLMHVNTDTNAPFIVSASSLDGNTIGVCFSEPVDPNTAGEPSNYYLNGDTQLNPIAAVVRTNIDPRTVILTMAAPLVGTFQLDATFISDFAVNQNFGDSTVNGTVQNLTPMDIGTPLGAGSSFTCTNGEIDVVAGGADIWGTADQGHFTIGQRSGNFDIWARVDSLTRGALDNDGITKAGLMIRDTVDAGSRKIQVLGEPPAAVGGRDFYEAGQRPTLNAATAAWSGGSATGTGPFGIPNGWIRIRRSNDLFTAYRSSNGVDWVIASTHTLALSNTVYLGLAATAHLPVAGANPSGTVQAKFRNVHIPTPPSISVQPSPADQTVPIHANVSYTVSGINTVGGGPLVYQWLKNGRPIPGATAATLNLNNVSTDESAVYTVNVGNDGGAAVSTPVTLVVSNAPVVAGANTLVTTQDVALVLSAASLLANDSDPEGDPISIFGVNGVCSAVVRANFNSLPPGAALFGSAYIDTTGGVGNSGALKLTDAVGSQQGGLIIGDMSPGSPVVAFTATFKVRVGGGSGNPADGFSLSFGSDIPDGSIGEEGAGNGLIIAFDNYDNGAAEAPAIDVKWAGAVIPNGHVSIAKINTFSNYVDVVIRLDADGTLDVIFDGVTIYNNLATPYVPITGGRFGLGGRTGGEFEAHWVDDLSITVANRTPRGSVVTFDAGSGNITYTPATGITGADSFAYMVNDGQQSGTVCGVVNVTIIDPNAQPPLINPGSATYNSGTGTFSASFQTANGVSYTIQYKDDLGAATWTTLTVVVGDGTVKSFTDPGPLPPVRFYRVAQ
jgi:hypothetical protein